MEVGMRHPLLTGTPGLARGAAPVLAVALVSAALLAGGGPALAAAHGAHPAAQYAIRPATAGIISTVAGGSGGPGRASGVALPAPYGVATHGGYLYLADGMVAQKVLETSDELTAVAGTGISSPLGDGGPAISAGLTDVTGVAVTGSGNLVLGERMGDRIRMVAAKTGTYFKQPMIAGHIYTVAGNGMNGRSGNGGLATSAELSFAYGVGVDAAGNLLIADSNNDWIRVVAARAGTYYGRAMAAGHIYPVAGDGTGGYSGDGGPATSAELNFPEAVGVDAAGNLLIADGQGARIRVVAAATGTFYGQAMTAGDIYTIAGDGIDGHSGDGGPATSAELWGPSGVTVDAAGNVLIADQTVRVVAASTGTFYGQAMTAGDIYTIAGNGTGGYAGDGGPATSAELSPTNVAVDAAGNVLITDSENLRVRVVAASTGTYYDQPMTVGDIYTIAGNGTLAYSGDGGPATKAQLSDPAVTVDAAGNQVIADTGNNRIRVAAAATGRFYGQAMTAGHIYTVAGDGKPGDLGNRGVATQAELNQPWEATVDGAGNLLIADYGANRIRVVATRNGTFYGNAMTAGHIYNVAGDGQRGTSGYGGPARNATVGDPSSVSTDSAGDLIIAQPGYGWISVVAARTGTFYGLAMTAGDIYKVAGGGDSEFSGDGGPATSASLNLPVDAVVDRAGNILIADTYNNRIRVVAAATGTYYGQAMTVGDIYTIAGSSMMGYAGDGGPATSAALNLPQGVMVDDAGNVIIADTYNNRVRVVAAAAGTFYGQAMTAGDIYTVAGDGIDGYSGDGGPATHADIDEPASVAANAAGDLLIGTGDWVRMVTG
jgi:trimeric autotransporter adhesin